ncbi:MAG: dienelactone hydrolase family protein [Elusimicrobiota bacterium]
MPQELDGFEEFSFDTDRSDRAGGPMRTVYRRGKGPAVVLIHELPGMTPECVELARKVADEGFTVYMPLLFGEPNRNYGMTPLLRPCVWKEFSVLSKHGKSPAADWLRALARQAHAEQGGKGVGAIGMCFTGRFALSLMMDAEMIAPVLSQPASSYSSSAPGIPLEEWNNAVKRSRDENIPVLGFRFTGDRLCRRERFDALREGFGERFNAVEVDGPGHSVLTMDFNSMEAPERARVWGALIGFLSRRLK